MKKKPHSAFLAAVLLIMFSAWFYRDLMNEFPRYIHAWTQADRYALALGFIRNGFDFLHPRTYNLNMQFPAEDPPEELQGITAANFPIHDYAVAGLMKFFGTRDPWVYRGYVLSLSLAGMLFLFLASRKLTGSVFAGLLVMGFALTSPVFTYYQAGFIATIPSLAAFFAAFYFYARYMDNAGTGNFIAGATLLTLASLTRTPFAVFLISASVVHLLVFIRQKRNILLPAICYGLSYILVIGYFLHNEYLRRNFGSLFLSEVMPAGSIREFLEITAAMLRQWGSHFLTVYHVILLALTLIFSIILFSAKRILNGATAVTAFFLIFSMAGTLFYYIMMAEQFRRHDYYFLDTFFTVIVVLFFLTLMILRLNMARHSVLIILLLLLFMPFALLKDKKIQGSRRTIQPWDRVSATVDNFMGSGSLLDSLGVGQDDKILVIDAYAPPIPFILMDRQGFAVTKTTEEAIERALGWDYDYVVMQDEFMATDVVRVYPEILSELGRVGGNGKISLFRQDRSDEEKDLIRFLGLHERRPVINIRCEFSPEDSLSEEFPGIIHDTVRGYGKIPKEGEFASLLPGNRLQRPLTDRSVLSLEMHIQVPDYAGNSFIVATGSNEDLYKSYDLETFLREEKEWSPVHIVLPVHSFTREPENAKLYIWNPGGNMIRVDDLTVRFY